jgi:hypothetical protein
MKIVCAAIALAAAVLTQPRTLEDVVRDEIKAVPRPPLPREVGAIEVADGVVGSKDERGNVLAWWMHSGNVEALHIFAIDRPTGAWHHHEVAADTLDWAGSLRDTWMTPRFIGIAMHLTPSAVETIVYRRDLSFVGTFHGWTMTGLPNDLVVYQESQPHFQPTYHVRVSVYDPGADKTREIYPPPTAARVRREYIELVQRRWAALGENWFREHNHHGDPTRFDNGVASDVAVDWPRGLAFLVNYRDEPPRDVVGMDTISLHVIVTCDGLTTLGTIACRETNMSDWERRFPAVDRDGLLARAAAQPRLVQWQ